MSLLIPMLLAAASASPACPASSFEVFARRFVDDVAVQRRFTAAIVTRSRTVDADPEPKTVSETHRLAPADFPLAPPSAERVRKGLVLRIDAPNSALVVSASDGDSFQLRFTFQRTDCWRLVRIDDEAL